MQTSFLTLLDIIAAMALIIALGSAYARLKRWSAWPLYSQLALGMCFGCVAGLEMNHPIEPFDGVIVDLRNIPLALAGAFLGLPGAFLTLAIAVGVRVGIGGVGVWAGLAGMLISVGAGYLWQQWQNGQAKRSITSLLALGAMTSIHLVASVLLPTEAFLWFITEAALPIFALNMLIIPLMAGFLEAERRAMISERDLREAAHYDPESGMMLLPALQRECTIRDTALADGSFTHAAILRLRATHVMSCWHRPAEQKMLMSAMRLRLKQAFPKCDLACMHGASTLVVPLTQAELFDFDKTRVAMTRIVTEDAYNLHGAGGHRIAIDLEVIRIPERIADLEALCSRRSRLGRQTAERWRGASRNASIPHLRSFAKPYQSDLLVETLFDKADVLISQRTPGR